MKYKGRIILLIISLVTSLVFFVNAEERGLLLNLFSLFHAYISWIFGGWYDKYRFLSYHDPLTGIYNRWYAYKVFEKQFHRAMRREGKVGVLNIDVDNFKMINDTFGHAYGDIVLKKICHFIQKSIGKKDIFARWGGDEFLILFTDRDMESAQQLKENIIEAVQIAVEECEEINKWSVTLSIGLSLFPEDNVEKISELISIADERMYIEKNAAKSKREEEI